MLDSVLQKPEAIFSVKTLSDNLNLSQGHSNLNLEGIGIILHR